MQILKDKLNFAFAISFIYSFWILKGLNNTLKHLQ